MKRNEKLLRSMGSELLGLQALSLRLGAGDETLKLIGKVVNGSALIFTEAFLLLADEMGGPE